jgi:hypothetical protein
MRPLEQWSQMPIYDRPTKTLMAEYAAAHLKPGQTFQKREPLEWFRQHYPKIKSNTVGMHVEGMSVNNATQRKHSHNVKPERGFDLFFKLGPNRFRLWDPENDPPPVYRDEILEKLKGPPLPNADHDDSAEEDDGTDASSQGDREFAFERDLRNYLSRNLFVLEDGLRLYEDEDREFTGIEYPAGGRFIDILAVDRDGGYVVIELKVSRGYDRVMGQLLRYMAWIEQNLANGKNVRGVIIASEITDDLKLASSRVADVQLWQYELEFKLRPVAR